MAKVNYTKEQETELVDFYIEQRGKGETNEVVLAQINEKFNRAVKSARAKLVSLKVYTADPKPEARAKDEGPTKKELMADLSKFGIDVAGSENASKPFLSEILRILAVNGIEPVATEAVD